MIVNALRWDILNDWVRYLNDDAHPDKTAEMAYVWGFIKRDFGGDALRCLWSKHQTSYGMFTEVVWSPSRSRVVTWRRAGATLSSS
ncbi:hypothetical protein ACFVYF_23495 [Streptomyces sp. NPDC058274]|uniref:hypothetical protein n=1 Tax=Streptomyces sp. NPDC058274 TaxID=3346416 RepID=UPI0036EDE05E